MINVYTQRRPTLYVPAHLILVLISEFQTASLLHGFILEMVRNPHVRRTVQAELGVVVGNERLPKFSDRPSLPYLEATLRETQRLHPVAPLGKHANRND